MESKILYHPRGINHFKIHLEDITRPIPYFYIMQEVKPRWWESKKRKWKKIKISEFLPECGEKDCDNCKNDWKSKYLWTTNHFSAEDLLKKVRSDYKSIHRENRLKSLLQ